MILVLVMQNKFKRKDFLKLALLTNLALMAKPLEVFSEKFADLNFPSSNDNVRYFKKGDADYNLLRKGFNKRIEKFPLIIA